MQSTDGFYVILSKDDISVSYQDASNIESYLIYWYIAELFAIVGLQTMLFMTGF